MDDICRDDSILSEAVLAQFNALPVNADLTAAGGVRQPIVRLNAVQPQPARQPEHPPGHLHRRQPGRRRGARGPRGAAHGRLLPMNRSRHASGFSQPELLVTVVILGLIAAVGGGSLFNIVRRERASAVASELAGWLDQVSAESSRFRAQAGGGEPCTVTITTRTTLTTGAELARIEPAGCAPQATLTVPDLYYNNTLVQITADPARFVYTPRGTVATTTGAPLPNGEVQITMSVKSLPPLRCIRLTGLIGVLEVGRNNQATTGGTCDEWNRA